MLFNERGYCCVLLPDPVAAVQSAIELRPADRSQHSHGHQDQRIAKYPSHCCRLRGWLTISPLYS
jgi:hypothetical protein